MEDWMGGSEGMTPNPSQPVIIEGYLTISNSTTIQNLPTIREGAAKIQDSGKGMVVMNSMHSWCFLKRKKKAKSGERI